MKTTLRTPFLAGNWKLNGDLKTVTAFKQGLLLPSHAEIVICPPSLYVHHFTAENFGLGLQNVSEFDSGAHTGELSASMARECGCQYAIVGHSERRGKFDETDITVGKKLKACIDVGIQPILCLGEPLVIRERGKELEYIRQQLDIVLSIVGHQIFKGTVIAYEPIWAIGTGVTASPQEAQTIHASIRDQLAMIDSKGSNDIRIIYGGSVNATNAREIFAQRDIDGGLVGGASLHKDQFESICSQIPQ
ncbi:MAG: triose-phosphate isomerase [Glaciecola sp.]